MKKLFFAVVLTFGSFMFINAHVQVQPQDDPQNTVTEVQDTTVVQTQEGTTATDAQNATSNTDVQQNDSVSNAGNAVVKQ